MLKLDSSLRFFYIPTFHDMRCKHDQVLAIIREQLRREPDESEAYMIMSRDRRQMRILSFGKLSASLFDQKFRKGYKYLKVEKEGGETVYRIRWDDVLKLFGCPAVNTLKIR